MEKHHATIVKAICALLCLMFLCCNISLATEEPAFANLWNAGYQLAFETENVTLSGNAEFFLDGEWFKTYSVGYMQDGNCSYLLIHAQTPQDNGSIAESGYEVLAQENGDLFIHELNKPYYYHGKNLISSPVISSRNIRRAADAAQPFVLAVLPAMLPGAGLAVETTAEGENLRLVMKENDVPVILQQMMLPLLTEFTEKYFFITPGETADHFVRELTDVHYEDSKSLEANVYADLYGKELPQDMYEEVNALYTPDDNGIKPSDAVNAVIREKIASATAGGNKYVYLHTDGTVESFATKRELSEASGQVSLVFSGSFTDMLILYTEQKTGKPADENLISALVYWDYCPQLKDDFNAAAREMKDYYTSIALQDEKAIGIQIMPDLDYVLLYSDEEILRACSNLTTTRYLVSNMDEFLLGDTDVRFTMDNESRLTGVEGSISFPTRLKGKYEHTVEMRFSCRAENYGETDAHSLTPDGVLDVPEFSVWYDQNPNYYADQYSASRYDENRVTPPPFPFTVEFNGKEYTIEKTEPVH